mgnify:CR=1 FL=1
MVKQSNWVRAHTNIAFIKYWGKENEELIIPKNNSLSLTLDAFHTDTQVTFDGSLSNDILFIDGGESFEKSSSHFRFSPNRSWNNGLRKN